MVILVTMQQKKEKDFAVMHSCSAYHEGDVMICFFSDIAVFVATISALVDPIPALCTTQWK